jgi:hypothetical protein
LIAENVGLDLERPDVRVALRGWVGFLEGGILAALGSSDTDREALIDASLVVFGAALATLGSDARVP